MPQAEPLTEREREAPHHYSGLLSVAEVAGELCISVNTVKMHLKSIYAKLAADRRGEAVRRAQATSRYGARVSGKESRR